MLSTIATAIEGRLKELSIFKAVEQSFNKKTLGMLPAAVFYLFSDQMTGEHPEGARDLTWEVDMLFSSVGQSKGLNLAPSGIDAVRAAFLGWVAVPKGGVMPAKVPEITFVGFEETSLIYSARLTMRVFPDRIQ